MGSSTSGSNTVLHMLQPPRNSRKKPRRVGRGTGSARGKTCGKGAKGQLSRSGGRSRPGFEGGQMPLIRRVPKRGFHNLFRRRWAEVNLSDLKRFPEGQEVGPDQLKQAGLVKGQWDGIKILGKGEIGHPLTVKAHAISAGARQKIESSGGKVVLLRGTKDQMGESGTLAGS